MIEGHGDDSYKYERPIIANFSSNVYNRIDLSGLKAYLCNRIGNIGNYPEPEPYTLERQIASKFRLNADEVCVTNGATEAIYLIAQTFRGANTAILQPTFSEYADACCFPFTVFRQKVKASDYRNVYGCCGCATPITQREEWSINRGWRI